MKRKHGPSVYYLTDKNIFDALQHKSATAKNIREKFLDNGFFFSENEDKDVLVEESLLYINDYFDYQFIANLVESKNKREPFTNSEFKSDISKSDLTKICQDIKDSEGEDGTPFEVSVKGNLITLKTNYVEVDYSKTELRQRSTKTATVEIELKDSSFTVRRQANDRAKEISDLIKKLVDKKSEFPVPESKISLDAIDLPEARSFFFECLIKGVTDYNFDRVKSALLKYPEDNDNDIDEENSEEAHEKENVVVGHIQKALLNGDSVLTSKEFSQLHENGFYITRITWTAVDKQIDGDKVEFTAQFADQVNCSDFRYLVKGIYPYKGGGEYNITQRQPSPIERHELTLALEEASRNAFEQVLAKYGDIE
jgi:hypothetical protein